jgi:cation diffusion facilitator CzcD-associated flavoprotein CzcO
MRKCGVRLLAVAVSTAVSLAAAGRSRKDPTEMQGQMAACGLPFDGLSVVQMQEALMAANCGAAGLDQDSQSCPSNGEFEHADRHEYCVIGAGPGGLQMAAFLHAAERDYVVFERAAFAGSFYKRYPRHRSLISINKRYTGRANEEFNWRHDWNSLLSPDSGPARDAPRFWEFSDDYFPAADAWVEYAERYAQGLNVTYSTEVVKVSRKRKSLGADFVVHTKRTDSSGSSAVSHTRCQTLIVATSLPKAYMPPIPGLEEVSVGYDDDNFSTNPEDYRNKTVMILGKKQSAMETAKSICQCRICF